VLAELLETGIDRSRTIGRCCRSDNNGALPSKCFRDGAADASRSAGNDRDPAIDTGPFE
jgi:hypothetical protein